jgi:hypothetical protein
MQKSWGPIEYTTKTVHDNQQGWTAVELHETKNGSTQIAARVVFWDAQGQFFLQVSVPEIPLTIAESLIAEARAAISVS